MSSRIGCWLLGAASCVAVAVGCGGLETEVEKTGPGVFIETESNESTVESADSEGAELDGEGSNSEPDNTERGNGEPGQSAWDPAIMEVPIIHDRYVGTFAYAYSSPDHAIDYDSTIDGEVVLNLDTSDRLWVNVQQAKEHLCDIELAPAGTVVEQSCQGVLSDGSGEYTATASGTWSVEGSEFVLDAEMEIDTTFH